MPSILRRPRIRTAILATLSLTLALGWASREPLALDALASASRVAGTMSSASTRPSLPTSGARRTEK